MGTCIGLIVVKIDRSDMISKSTGLIVERSIELMIGKNIGYNCSIN